MTLLTIQEATQWAKGYLRRNVSKTNISYLVQYGKVKKYQKDDTTLINLKDLKAYYDAYAFYRQKNWKAKLGNDLNWNLSFSQLREKDTTKHVHRLHPYKGKFIPQLVEYFLDDHTDNFKRNIYFDKGDTILDPFLGSGTTIVQANELGINGIGVDASVFNCMIARCKIQGYDLEAVKAAIRRIKIKIEAFGANYHIIDFEKNLLQELSRFNKKYFPNPDFKYQVNAGKIDEKKYAKNGENKFLPIYKKLLNKYHIKLENDSDIKFIDKWYINNVRQELYFTNHLINSEISRNIKELLSIVLSRTARSCRATTHSDLATLKSPQFNTYYCYKHRKICKPIFSMITMFNKYAEDTLRRIKEFSELKKDSHYLIIDSDSRTVDIFKEVQKQSTKFHEILKKNKIKGIFSSPPYVGQINYHEQHSYAYNLFKFPRKDKSEIGPLYMGQGSKARKSYIQGISDVLSNCKKYLTNDYNVFLVANDKYNLYPSIAQHSGMKIVNQYKRPVLNRTERDRNPYSETIFHLKKI